MTERHSRPLTWHAAAGRFLFVLPAWLAATSVTRIGELLATGPVNGRIAAAAAGFDVIDFLRWLPLLFLPAWPLLRRTRPWALAMLWSVLLLAQIGLSSYFVTAHTPLGADLFAYSIQEILTTVRGADVRAGPMQVLVVIASFAVLWIGLVLAWRPQTSAGARALPLLLVLSVLAWLLPLRGQLADQLEFDAQLRAEDKAGFFLQSVAGMLTRVQKVASGHAAPLSPVGTAPASAEQLPLDPNFPFLRPEQTPDVLGAHFSKAQRPPTLVFLIVEGLGRDFSGPEARLGSFTPFLDELAQRSLYFDHFVAPQGRTFAVLPSLFGSLPFATQGFSDLGAHMPAHNDLFSVLKANGYDTRFYSTFDLNFDKQREYLERQGVGKLRDYPWYRRNHPLPPGSSEWGYPDGELVRLALIDEAQEADAPAVVALQTITMHTDYNFPGRDRYRARVLERLRELAIPESRWQSYRDNIDIYASVLYTDDAMRSYFEGAQKLPGYANTVFILTGDHRLPELPMADVFERYHVPLLMHSPLLKAPMRVRSVSSQFDVTPSLLAWLSKNYGVRTPEAVTWMGRGLDFFPEYRNLKEIPIKPVKGESPSLLLGDWYLLRGQLFKVSSQLSAERIKDAKALSRLESRLAAFEAANQRMVATGEIAPSSVIGKFVTWDARSRAAGPTNAAAEGDVKGTTPPQLQVRDAQLESGKLRAIFVNAGGQPSSAFVPLVVVTDSAGKEVGEVSGNPLTLAAGETRTLQIDLPAVPTGKAEFVAVLPADPATGKRVGEGRFHIPIGTP